MRWRDINGATDPTTVNHIITQAQAARAAAAAAAKAQEAAAPKEEEEEGPRPVVIHAMDREGRPIQVGREPAEERREDARRRRTGKLKVRDTWLLVGCRCVE